jgi:hypothetical protein
MVRLDCGHVYEADHKSGDRSVECCETLYGVRANLPTEVTYEVRVIRPAPKPDDEEEEGT